MFNREFTQKALTKQFILYPLLLIVVLSYVENRYEGFILIETIHQTVELMYTDLYLDRVIPSTQAQILIHYYMIGFSYGTLSLFIQVHKLRSIIAMAIVLFFKLGISIFYCVFAYPILILEVIVLAVAIPIRRKQLKNFKIKFEEEQRLEREKAKTEYEDIVENKVRKVMKEFRNERTVD